MSVVFSLGLKKSPCFNIADDVPEKHGFFLKGDNGATVILIHGLTGTPNEMRYLANSLNRSGYSVLAPRLANHLEPIHILKNTKWTDIYKALREVLVTGELAKSEGPVFTAGLSMGALLALLLADEFNDRIAGVSCLAPTLFYDGWNAPISKYLLPLASGTFIKHFFYFKEEPPYGIKNETVQKRIHKYYNSANLDDAKNIMQYGYPYFPVTLLCQLRSLVKHLSKRLPHMRTPAQMIQARDDDVASVKNSKYIYDHIGSDVKELILLYDSYHVITADQERDIVAEKVEKFYTAARSRV